MPRLIVIKHNLAVKEQELEGTVCIGRHESNQIQLDEDRASRIHCRIMQDRGRSLLEDLDSANGIYVNGLKVKSHLLSNNDRITIGGSTLVFSDAPPEAKGGDTVVLKALDDIPLKVAPKSVPNKVAPPRPRTREKTSKPEGLIKLAFTAVLMCGAIIVLVKVLQSTPQIEIARSPVKAIRKIEAPVVPAVSAPLAIAVPEAPILVEAPRVPLDTRYKSAQSLRDRALTSGNFLGAKAALRSFINALNAEESRSEFALRAQRDLGETESLTRAALELALTQAREALNARRFQTAIQRSTNVLSNDPLGESGKQARTLLEGIDEHTAPVAEAARTKSQAAIKLGNLDLARAALEQVMGELSGTRWAGDISALHLQLIMASGLLAEIETARAKSALAGKPVHVSLGNKKIDGTLTGLKGLNAQITSGEATIAVSLTHFETADLNRLLNELDFEERHAELGCLWTILGRKDAALAESEAALKHPGRAPLAASLAGMLAESKNLHLYDFSGWRQLADWDALSGSWLTLNERYVLESGDGGETVLKEERIGGAFQLESARLNFEVELMNAAPGWFFSCDFGSATQGVSIQLSESGACLTDKSGAKKSETFKLAGTSARVELALDGDDVLLNVDGRYAAKLSIPELSRVKGTLGFQARLCGCALDNVVLRSVTKSAAQAR